MKRFRLYYHRSCIRFGFGGEVYRTCEDDGSDKQENLHLSVDFLFWSAHWNFVLRKLP